MTVECIAHKDLKSYLISPRYLKSEVLPISRHRGLSHLHNPHALPDDVLLINIYIERKLVAYLGILPDNFFLNKEKIHLGWLSCLWVAPNSRGKGLAKKLLNTAWEKWNHNLILTDFTPQAEALYKRIGYFDLLTSREGIKCYYRLNLTDFLQKKNEQWRYLKMILQLSDTIFNFCFSLKKLMFKEKINQKITFQESSIIDTDILEFIHPFKEDTLSKKNEKDFNWLMEFPWIQNSMEAKEDQKRYYFSSFAKHFQVIYLKIYSENKLCGFLILTIKDDALKIPFVFFNDEDYSLVKEITSYIINLLKTKKLSTIHISNPSIRKCLLNKRHTFFLVRKFKKKCLISKTLIERIPNSNFYFQDGEGDAAFT